MKRLINLAIAAVTAWSTVAAPAIAGYELGLAPDADNNFVKGSLVEFGNDHSVLNVTIKRYYFSGAASMCMETTVETPYEVADGFMCASLGDDEPIVTVTFPGREFQYEDPFMYIFLGIKHGVIHEQQ
jgi:hypothetical protein